ncbi:MAG TPA: hypothetical protein K8V15_11145 [Tessaracoccus flavescens]|uniref:Uncharacterized protein n=1 Tax=Tessaracoccus flavescens TaxID=399497 RepID=A0A921ES93_9ACTN|nr:hypothetical protein [Tessaracoccus flavescens]
MRPASLLASLLVALGGLALAAPAASADVTNGHCTSDTGVTLVVDFQDLGGKTIIKCVEDVTPGTTGLQILQKAGMNPAGTVHDGPGFVCRINDRPSRSETIPITGQPDYRETCRLTPPSGAFWSYWHADNGGSWTFSQFGAGNRAAIVGGYEGWSFSLNRTEDSSPRPGVKPLRPKAEPTKAPSSQVPAPSTPAPRPTTSSAAPTSKAPASKAPASKVPATKSPTAKAPAPASKSPASTAPTAAKTTAAGSTASAVESTTAASASGTASASATTPDATTPAASPSSMSAEPSATATETPAPPVAAEQADSVPVGTLVGAGAVATLGAAGGVVWWRRRGV